jgi:hypothetical protein
MTEFRGFKFPEMKVDAEMLRGREMQRQILDKLLEHKYKTLELETMRLIFIEEIKYNEELYNGLETLKKKEKRINPSKQTVKSIFGCLRRGK